MENSIVMHEYVVLESILRNGKETRSYCLLWICQSGCLSVSSAVHLSRFLRRLYAAAKLYAKLLPGLDCLIPEQSVASCGHSFRFGSCCSRCSPNKCLPIRLSSISELLIICGIQPMSEPACSRHYAPRPPHTHTDLYLIWLHIFPIGACSHGVLFVCQGAKLAWVKRTPWLETGDLLKA